MKNLAEKIYYGKNPGELPAYEVAEAARYLRVPYTTLYEWLRPLQFTTDYGVCWRPIIQRPNGSKKLSFLNLIEGHIVKALRQEHNVPPAEIRAGIEYAERELQIQRLLINSELRAGVKQLFIEKFGQLINLGRGGQLAMERMLSIYLERIDYRNNMPSTLFPFVGGSKEKFISISPELAFGKPIIASKNITTYIIAERFDLGDSKAELAEDYGITEAEVEEAIIYEAAA